MMNLLLMLDEAETLPAASVNFCEEAGVDTLMSIAGVVISVIKIVVPIILIVVGMIELAKASTSKDEEAIKKAQKLLVKKLIIGLAVFIVPTIITLLMSVINNDDWKNCTDCLNSPWGPSCIQSIGSNQFK